MKPIRIGARLVNRHSLDHILARHAGVAGKRPIGGRARWLRAFRSVAAIAHDALESDQRGTAISVLTELVSLECALWLATPAPLRERVKPSNFGFPVSFAPLKYAADDAKAVLELVEAMQAADYTAQRPVIGLIPGDFVMVDRQYVRRVSSTSYGWGSIELDQALPDGTIRVGGYRCVRLQIEA